MTESINSWPLREICRRVFRSLKNLMWSGNWRSALVPSVQRAIDDPRYRGKLSPGKDRGLFRSYGLVMYCSGGLVKVMVKHEVRVSKSERILPLPVPVTWFTSIRGNFSLIISWFQWLWEERIQIGILLLSMSSLSCFSLLVESCAEDHVKHHLNSSSFSSDFISSNSQSFPNEAWPLHLIPSSKLIYNHVQQSSHRILSPVHLPDPKFPNTPHDTRAHDYSNHICIHLCPIDLVRTHTDTRRIQPD